MNQTFFKKKKKNIYRRLLGTSKLYRAFILLYMKLAPQLLVDNILIYAMIPILNSEKAQDVIN